MPRTRGARLLFGVFGSVFAVIAVPHSTQVTALADAPCLYTLDFYFLLFTISLLFTLYSLQGEVKKGYNCTIVRCRTVK